MRTAVKFAAVSALLIGAMPAAASDSNWLRIGEGGWLPALGVFGGTTIQKQHATGESICAWGGTGEEPSPGDAGYAPCQGLENFFPILRTPDVPLRPAISGSDWIITPILGFDLELSTPSFDFIPGDPRLFFRGELQLDFANGKRIANEGDPTGIRLIRPVFLTPTYAVLGTGTTTSSETQLLQYGAGAGIAFPFEFRGRRIWVKPGGAWTQYGVKVEGLLIAAVKNDPKEPRNGNFPQVGDQLRDVTLQANETRTFNGIGPSLEIEMDVGHFGPIGASVFVNGAAYKVLGNRTVDLRAVSEDYPRTTPTTCCPEDPPGSVGPLPKRALPADTYTADWSLEVDPWLYRAAIGVRFHWFGF